MSLLKYLLKEIKSKRLNLFEKKSICEAKVNNKVLLLDGKHIQLLPATIDKIINDCLLIKDDNTNEILCYPLDDTLCLLPYYVGKTLDIPLLVNGVQLFGKDKEIYLDKYNLDAAPLRLENVKNSDESRFPFEFPINGSLEVIHHNYPEKICQGIVLKVSPPLIWIQLAVDTVIVLPCNTTQIFPCGFAQNNEYPLTKLLKSSLGNENKNKEISDDEENEDNENKKGKNKNEKKSSENNDKQNSNKSYLEEMTLHSTIPKNLIPSSSKAWCPPLYFNHKCFTGPSLSKSKICELPRKVGPGPVQLVIKEVISKLISVAYVPTRVLNELSSKTFDNFLKMQKIKKTIPIEFKAKYQKRCYRDNVTIVRSSEFVEQYCRAVCSHLKCCYNLFGKNLYDGEHCPSNCRGLTKSNKVLKRAIYYREKAAEANNNNNNSNNNNSQNNSSNNPAAEASEVNTKDSSISNNSNNKKRHKNSMNENIKSSSTTNSEKDDLDEHNDNEAGRDGDDEEDDTKCEAKKKKIKTRSIDEESGKSPISDDNQSKLNQTKKENIEKPIKSKLFQNSLPIERTIKSPLQSSDNSKNLVTNYFKSNNNPLNWSVKDVYNIIKKSNCANFAKTLLDHEIDGTALLLLDHETIKANLLTGYARFNNQDVIKLDSLIQKLKLNWYKSVEQTVK